MTTPSPFKPIPPSSRFNVGYHTFASEALAVAITAPLKAIDFSRFDNLDDALDAVTTMTRERLSNDAALVGSYDKALTSRLNEDSPLAINEVYRTLSPLAPKADALTLAAADGTGIFLNELPMYGARTLVNVFIATYIDTIMDMVKRYGKQLLTKGVYSETCVHQRVSEY